MTPTDIGTEIYTELDSSTVSQSAIEYWLRVNVGKLNSRIYSAFTAPASNSADYIDQNTGETMDEDQKNIYKSMYYLRYYQKMIDLYTGAAGVQTILELNSDGGRVKMIDKNSLSKTYIELRKSLIESLDQEIYSYLYGKASPSQVAGDDTIANDGQTQQVIRS